MIVLIDRTEVLKKNPEIFDKAGVLQRMSEIAQLSQQLQGAQKQIKEFMDNVDKQFYQAILDHITNQRDAFSVKPFKGTTTEEEQKRGAPKEFDVPITFDQSNFFA